MSQPPNATDLVGRHGQMFPVLTDAQIARAAKFGKEERFTDGAILWDQGDERVACYVVLEGELEVVHPRARFEDPVSLHATGGFTGEVNMLFDRRSLVRGRAKGALRVLRIEVPRLRALVQTDSELSEIVMRAFILRRVGLLSAGYGDAVVIGSRDSAASLRVQAFLTRNGHPYQWVDVDRDPDVQSLLDEFDVGIDDVPVLICRGERVLKNPSDADVAACLGFNASLDFRVVRDVVICGAGPAGLAAAVYGASEGLDVLIIEAGTPGGQAASSSKIENYLGFPTGVSGQALAGRALIQAEKFGAQLSVARPALRIHCKESPFRIDLVGGESIRTRSVIIATGAEYRKLDVPELGRFEGVGVYYAATSVESNRCVADDVIVVGGGNSAGQAATFLARTSRHVHLLIRGLDLAVSMSRYLVRRIDETANITLHRNTQIIGLDGGEHLERVTWQKGTDSRSTHAIRHVFSMAGAKPNTGWLRGCVALDDKDFVTTGVELTPETLRAEGWSLPRAPSLFETSQPRIFAVGDVRSNSVKRVASAVGEGSVCIQLVHKVLAE